MFREKKGWICSILVALVVLLCLPLPVSMRVNALSRDFVLPYQSFALLVRIQLVERFSLLMRASHAGEHIRELEKEVTELRFRNSELQSVARENRWLRRQLDFRESNRAEMVCCRVVARGGSSGWWETVRLNRGSGYGIREGHPVVTSQGLIGRVSSVSALTCDVLLISDRRSRIACEIEIPGSDMMGVSGIVAGQGARASGRTQLEMLFALDPLRMTYIENADVIPPDAKVSTSGLGGIYPRGLAVGGITKVTRTESGLYYEARVVPSANLAALSYVFVLLGGER